MKVNFFSLSIFLVLSLYCLPSSGLDEEESSIHNLPNNPNETYLNFALVGLAVWDIGLRSKSSVGQTRNVTESRYHIYNPPNWITVAGSNCRAGGIPHYLRDEGCDLDKPGVIALCAFRSYTSGGLEGQIIDTTIIIKKEALLLLDSTQNLDIFIHEVGHCLGLQHWGNEEPLDSAIEPLPALDSSLWYTDHIMYPSVSKSGKGKPNKLEIEAIQAVYNSCRNDGDCKDPDSLPNVNDCASVTIENDDTITAAKVSSASYADYETYFPCYYTQTGDAKNRAYQRRLPEFVISSAIGNAYRSSEVYELGPPLLGEVETKIYILKDDGTEDIKYASKK